MWRTEKEQTLKTLRHLGTGMPFMALQKIRHVKKSPRLFLSMATIFRPMGFHFHRIVWPDERKFPKARGLADYSSSHHWELLTPGFSTPGSSLNELRSLCQLAVLEQDLAMAYLRASPPCDSRFNSRFNPRIAAGKVVLIENVASL
ncbi:hypothetical protein Q8A67_021209 [Cirrhinus molitorella]|uniref:Uncharacterized protein n=1 Tax=Cirrhinus molitorella TaxID=172907 RepID=A0AA88P843_9TELE|nr:hypothetical protein Q8A67_021209 [Cirrhinus molitorella]